MDTAFTYVPEGLLLSTPGNREYTSSLAGLEHAMASGAILEGVASLCDASLHLHIDFPLLPMVRAIIPHHEAVYSRPGEIVKDIAILTRVGKPVCFKVMAIEPPDAHGIIQVTLSRRAAQAACAAAYLAGLIPGDIVRGRVTHLENFGAFVDIGCGLASLLSVDTISVSRILHPRDRLYNGQLIWAVVRSVEPISGRIFLSTRELLGTWEENAACFEPGQTVMGIVRSIESYGVFVELAPNLAGLAELREGNRTLTESWIGRTAAVFIKNIIPERMKVKLVLIDVSRDDPRPTPKLTYFIDGDQTSHMNHWLYSPAASRRRVESVFE